MREDKARQALRISHRATPSQAAKEMRLPVMDEADTTGDELPECQGLLLGGQVECHPILRDRRKLRLAVQPNLG
jgi:hypothetical protein